MKFRRILPIGGLLLLLLVVFLIDLIRKNIGLGIGGLSVVRELMILGAFLLLFLALGRSRRLRKIQPMKNLGVLMIGALIIAAVALLFGLTVDAGFEEKAYELLPLSYGAQFVATFLGIAFGTFSVLVLRLLMDLILYKRKRSTVRLLRIFIGLVLATAISTIMLLPLESGSLTQVLYGAAVVFAVMNAFRLSWIVYLSKREKLVTLAYGFFLFGVFLLLNVVISQNTLINQSLLYYSYPLKQFISLVCLTGAMYFGMGFVSTLFHLPTAEAFDRKTTEVSSLHALSKLVNQLFDFDELVDSVTSMTLQVCEAQSCWLELIHYADDPAVAGSYRVEIVGMKNISEEEVRLLGSAGETTMRDLALQQRTPLVIDDLQSDPRLKEIKKSGVKAGSLVVVPLRSQSGPLGILYATKESDHGFFTDDVDVISAFADQASVAIENSRLIKKSIERERLLREMMVAQEMQRKLLPQTLPQFDTLEIDAISTPALEVGGDYYDFLQLDDTRLGVIVGDVSGKGISAAFYMSEVKGIFQALGRLYFSPREFMIKANEALAGSIDKHSFISLIYAVIDITTGRLTLSRAGHCPMVHVSGDSVTYVRPLGMGLGLSRDSTFSSTMEEQTLILKDGDVCVFYTDGVTEARRESDEFGYERLLDAVVQHRHKSAAGLKEELLKLVHTHVNGASSDDDLTVVVMKWKQKGTGGMLESNLEAIG